MRGTRVSGSRGIFGSVPATIESAKLETLTVIAPPNTVGKYPITVVNPGGQSAPSNKAVFTYKGWPSAA